MSKMIYPENPDYLTNLLENFEKQKSINTEQGWEKIYKRIKSDKNRTLFLRYAKIASAVLLPLFLLWQYIALLSTEEQNLITVTSSQYGVSKIILPDESEVWLNASSEIRYPQRFKKRDRQVKLNGEAYFKVKADQKKPFNVAVSNNLVVSAYGTEFNVNGYGKSENYSVVLTNGSVKVSLPLTNKSAYLQPGQQALVTPSNNEINVTKADTYLQTAWKDGKIIFNREKFSDIADRLSKRFDVIFIFADKEIEEQQYTGTFTTESVTEILDLLKQSAPINYTIKYADEGSPFDVKKRIITIQTR